MKSNRKSNDFWNTDLKDLNTHNPCDLPVLLDDRVPPSGGDSYLLDRVFRTPKERKITTWFRRVYERLF